MTRQERIQQDIQFAQTRLAIKEAYLPMLEANVTDILLKTAYYAGIEQERQLIVRLSANLSKEETKGEPIC